MTARFVFLRAHDAVVIAVANGDGTLLADLAMTPAEAEALAGRLVVHAAAARAAHPTGAALDARPLVRRSPDGGDGGHPPTENAR